MAREMLEEQHYETIETISGQTGGNRAQLMDIYTTMDDFRTAQDASYGEEQTAVELSGFVPLSFRGVPDRHTKPVQSGLSFVQRLKTRFVGQRDLHAVIKGATQVMAIRMAGAVLAYVSTV